MGLFSKRKGSASSGPVDPTLPDPEWLGASHRRFESMVNAYYGSPDTMANGGEDRYMHQDFGSALFFFDKAVDMLQTAYIFNKMADRQPSPADKRIVDGYTSALGASLSSHPQAPVSETVRHTVGMLRSICTACSSVGMPNQLYMSALEEISRLAPQVRVDDIYW